VPAPVREAALALLAAGRAGPATALVDEAGAPVRGRRTPAWLIERRLPAPLTLFLFGAGHVGRAVAHVTGLLPARLVWADQRPDAFPEALPENAEKVPTADPVRLVGHAPPGTAFLVMTHSHALDYEITAAALARDDALWVGLIGSATKRARFERQMRSLGMDEARLARLVCPIGIPGVHGKSPGEIAVAVAAQLLLLLPDDAERRLHRAGETAVELLAP
jgi:xanthine dehydrogenase accessory factor